MSDPVTVRDSIAESVARNLREARGERGWTLDQLANRSGVSKGMLVQIEQARTNPSIGTLSKIGEALGVSLSDLVENTRNPTVQIVSGDEAARLWETDLGSTARLLVGGRRPEFVELWEWVLAPGDTYEGRPHPTGMRELLHVLEGSLTLTVTEVTTTVEAGASASYDGDQLHVYHNAAAEPLRFVLVMVDSTANG